MRPDPRYELLPLVLAVGAVDSLLLSITAFAAITNIRGTYPQLSARILLLSIVLLVVLAVTATVDERPGRR